MTNYGFWTQINVNDKKGNHRPVVEDSGEDFGLTYWILNRRKNQLHYQAETPTV